MHNRGSRLRPWSLVAACLLLSIGAGAQRPASIQFVFTSDLHYGITRPAFRGGTDVDAHVVNQAQVAAINRVPSSIFAGDAGLRAGQPVGALDFVAVGGDIANRGERTATGSIQTATASWAQFTADYDGGLTVTAPGGGRPALWIVPGNHDASNAVGWIRPMVPPVDNAAMVAIYNRMMRPAQPRTSSTYDYATDRVLTSRDLGGVHFVFLTVWPDSRARAWMDEDLKAVGPATPVVIFTHDQPDAESKHFINPNGSHDLNETDRFENLLTDQLADGLAVETPDLIEQRALEAFLSRHPNITGYFHGNSNWNQFYDWSGPEHTIALHTFRVDSPMKGAQSSKDETKLSFQVVTIDTASLTLTARECLWNTDPAHPSAGLAWGESRTVSLGPVTAAVRAVAATSSR